MSEKKVDLTWLDLFSLISIPFSIQARSVLELQVLRYCLNTDQDQLNVALTV